MKNPRLFSVMEAFCKASLPLFNFVPHVLTVEHLLQRAGLYDPLVKAITEDEAIAKHLNTLVGTQCGRTRLETTGIIRIFLITLMRQMKGIDFQETVFERTYKSFEEFFHSDAFNYRFIAPVTGLRLETDRLEVDTNLAIVKVSEQEREELLADIPAFYPSSSTAITHDFALEYFQEYPKIIGDYDLSVSEHPLEIVKRKFAETCSALRLFKQGSLAFNHIWMQNTTFSLEGIGPTHNPYSAPRLFDSYTLLNAEIPDFLAFWQTYKKAVAKPLKRLPGAISRFNFGYERFRPEDRLVDYIVAFEGLLLGDQQELRYKLALRCSSLLSANSLQRKAIFEELFEAYKQRNNVVHGGSHSPIIKINQTQIPFCELVDRTQEHLRSAIKRFLVICLEKSEKQAIEEIDQKIITGFPTNTANEGIGV